MKFAGLFIGAALASSLAIAPETAQARTYLEDGVSSTRTCYRVTYRPAVVRVNTRGQLVRPQTHGWVGVLADGASYDRVRTPAVFIETRRVLEPDHYSLRATACR